MFWEVFRVASRKIPEDLNGFSVVFMAFTLLNSMKRSMEGHFRWFQACSKQFKRVFRIISTESMGYSEAFQGILGRFRGFQKISKWYRVFQKAPPGFKGFPERFKEFRKSQGRFIGFPWRLKRAKEFPGRALYLRIL